MAQVTIRDLRKAYGAMDVLHGVNVDIENGQFVVLVGPSGCGKSTLLRMIAGLESITSGTIRIGDRVVNNLPPSDRDIAMVFQNYALYPHKTVAANMGFPLKMQRMDKAQIAAKVDRAADILGLKPYLARYPRSLSGGQRQRVAMGRAIVRDPQVFLFDEPLSNLDAKLRSELRVEIKRLHSRLNNTMVYVTHGQIEALTLADRIAVMRGGIIQQLDAPQVIYNRPANLFVAGFIGSPSMNFQPGATVDGGRSFRCGDHSLDLAGYEGGAVLDRPKAILGLRPEHLDLRHETDPGRSLPAVAEIDEPMGADSLVWLKMDHQQISVRVPVERRLKPGTEVQVHVDMSKASLFDAGTEQRILR
jgi:multiple sugar transport system ATP-binding protein